MQRFLIDNCLNMILYKQVWCIANDKYNFQWVMLPPGIRTVLFLKHIWHKLASYKEKYVKISLSRAGASVSTGVRLIFWRSHHLSVQKVQIKLSTPGIVSVFTTYESPYHWIGIHRITNYHSKVPATSKNIGAKSQKQPLSWLYKSHQLLPNI